MFVYLCIAYGCFCSTTTELIIVIEITWLNEPKTFLSIQPFVENLANPLSRKLSEWKTIEFLYIMFLISGIGI